jgi:hypothetical protein
MLPIQLNLRKSILILSGDSRASPMAPKLKVFSTVPSLAAVLSR